MIPTIVITPEVIKKLIESAHEAKKKSHSPYSNFRVGAAILTEEGKTIRGCNVENASYTLGLCAERVAIFKAVSDGYTNFKALAIACDVKDADLAPCGACRQIMHEFGGEYKVILSRTDFTYRTMTMKELLPMGFGQQDLKRPRMNYNNNN
ncbi:cytidine deaminase-like isoform X2 [Anneissia japonica]|uniref:cytidine deaminase-like isoform X2 n=1 Tax=Anneissia japonica TaxID=1529436 RepID=UPI0014258DAA|nr:cytidine deaminase-like isoform X2 [Anneissia japonica]